MKRKNKYKGYGALIGDIVGSIYEMNPIKGVKDFQYYDEKSHYTDDTIMTLATMSKLIHDSNYSLEYKWAGNKYYGDYYGKEFKKWLKAENVYSNFSYGNGAAMRISPIGYAFNNINDVYSEAIKSAMSSHNHHEAIKGALCISGCIFKLHNEAASKDEIYDYVCKTFYDLDLHFLEPFPKFKVSCQDTVPIAINAFLQSDDLMSCIRLCISLGGDCDTIASMAGELMNAYKGAEDLLLRDSEFLAKKLDKYQKMVLDEFNVKFNG